LLALRQFAVERGQNARRDLVQCFAFFQRAFAAIFGYGLEAMFSTNLTAFARE